MYVVYIIIAILILLLMIMIHEFGHYVAAKILKFKVVEFAIGFGPKIFKRKRKNGEIFSIRAFPLGGFCAFDGEDEIVSKGTDSLAQPVATESVGEDAKGNKLYAFNAQAPWKRIIVLSAGAIFNILSAFIFAFIFIAVAGCSVPKVASVYETSLNAGIIQQGDVIVGVNGEKIDYYNSFYDLYEGFKENDTVTLNIVRNKEETDITVTVCKYTYPETDSNNKPVLDDNGDQVIKEAVGIGFRIQWLSKGDIKAAFKDFVPLTAKMSWLVLGSFGKLITGQVAITDIGGPISTVKIMADQASANYGTLFLLMPLIAANLGIFNLMPIPALDGSKIIFCLVEMIRKKPINRNVEAWIHFGGLLALLGLVLIVELINLVIIPLLR